MTTHETLKAGAEARRAVSSSSAPVARLENALHSCLSASVHLSRPTSSLLPDPAVEVDARDAEPLAATVAAPGGRTAFGRSFVVVAGLDASSCARRAAGWAAAEADRRHGSLLLVHAYSLPPAGYSGYNPYPANLLPQLREDGETLLNDAADALRQEFPTLGIDTRMIYGDPATVLRHTSATAQLTVVGARGGHRIVSALGSVAVGIASTNPGPVVIIHPGAPAAPTGPVVVGVDGSPTGDAALAYAFEAASLRHARLVAVHCWTDPIIVGATAHYAEGIIDPTCVATEERSLLAQRLGPLAALFPDVVVDQVVIHGRPTPALLESSRTAQLTVVGSHGHSGTSGWSAMSLLLGSTSTALITHSPSPVVIVRSGFVG